MLAGWRFNEGGRNFYWTSLGVVNFLGSFGVFTDGRGRGDKVLQPVDMRFMSDHRAQVSSNSSCFCVKQEERISVQCDANIYHIVQH